MAHRIDDLPGPLIGPVMDVMRWLRAEENGEPGKLLVLWPTLDESCALRAASDCGLIDMKVTHDGFHVRRKVGRI